MLPKNSGIVWYFMARAMCALQNASYAVVFQKRDVGIVIADTIAADLEDSAKRAAF